MRTDFDQLPDGARITIHPLPDNPLHKKPVIATHQFGYFYCDGTDPMEGPDYYLGNVLRYCEGFTTD